MFKKALCVILITIIALTPMCYAEGLFLHQSVDLNQATDSDEAVTFIIELSGGGILQRADETPLSSLSMSEKASIKQSMNTVSVSAEKAAASITGNDISVAFSHIMNGFAIEGNINMYDSLKEIPNVENVYISQTRYKIPENITASDKAVYFAETTDNETTPIAPMGATDNCVMREALIGHIGISENYTGKGMVIGIIDSELNPNHSAFAASPENPRYSKEDIAALIKSESLSASKLSKVSFDADAVYKSSKIPFTFDYCQGDANPYLDISDLNSHGSHVSGIAAGKSTDNSFYGTASDAQIIFMKASPDGLSNGSFSDYYLLSALDDLVKLDVDVINMSLGGITGFSDIPLSSTSSLNYSRIYSDIQKSGIAIIASAGNSDRIKTVDGTYTRTDYIDYSTLGEPASYSPSTAVASSTLNKYNYMQLNGSMLQYLDLTPKYLQSGFEDMLLGSAESGNFGFAQLTTDGSTDVNGKLAYIDQSSWTYDVPALAADQGAIGIIFIGNNTNLTDISYTSLSGELPIISVSSSSGALLKAAEVGSYLTVTKYDSYNRQMAASSSWGVTPELSLKPEITTVGEYVYSAVPSGNYALKRGTSMSAPQYSGAVAVMLEYISEKYPALTTDAALRAEQLLAATAVPLSIDNLPVSPRKQGAGRVNIENAMTSPVVIYSDTPLKKVKLELGEIMPTTDVFQAVDVSFIALNQSAQAVTYTLSGDIFTDGYITLSDGTTVVDNSALLGNSYVKFSSNTVTIQPNSTKTINATIYLDTAAASDNMEVFANGFYIDGYLKLSSTNGQLPELSIPYMGFYGGFDSMPIFAENSSVAIKGIAGNSLYKLNFIEDTAYYSSVISNGVAFSLPNQRAVYKIERRLRHKDSGTESPISTMYFINNYMLNRNSSGNIVPNVIQCLISPGSLGEGKYEIQLDIYRTKSSSPTTLIYDIVVDNTAPVYMGAEYTQQGLSVTATDNCGYAAAVLLRKDGTNYRKYFSKTAPNTYTIDPSGLALDEYYFCVFDPAQNSSSDYDIKSANGFAASYNGNILSRVQSFPALVVDGSIISKSYIDKSKLVGSDDETVYVYAWTDDLEPITAVESY